MWTNARSPRRTTTGMAATSAEASRLPLTGEYTCVQVMSLSSESDEPKSLTERAPNPYHELHVAGASSEIRARRLQISPSFWQVAPRAERVPSDRRYDDE